MTKIIPRNLIKHLEWQEGQAIASIANSPKKPSPIKGTLPKDNLSYTFLEGDFGKNILNEYKNLVQSDYNNAQALDVLTFKDNVLKGSNPFASVLLNKILQQNGIWVARPGDLERALESGTINLKDTYGDSAFVLRSTEDPNTYLAQNLMEQVTKEGFNTREHSLMIP